MNHTSRVFLAAVAAAVASTAAIACAPVQTRTVPIPAPASVPPPTGRAAALSNDTHWARNSAEHRAIYVEVYRAAGARLATLIAGHPAETWGVILDADETVLDNSDYQKSRAPFGGTFDAVAWTAWVNEGRAPALPGALEFVSLARQLGGRVVIVTNRDQAQCPITRANLEHLGMITDAVLCKTTTTNKNARFEAVQRGTAVSGLAPLTVLEWVGDNIEDFPMLDQNIRYATEAAYAKFGDTYFALPNAMYGSWERNPRQ
ncbi:MAG: HAD family acid phosphatase [Gemmatimonadaceae bacterium]